MGYLEKHKTTKEPVVTKKTFPDAVENERLEDKHLLVLEGCFTQTMTVKNEKNVM